MIKPSIFIFRFIHLLALLTICACGGYEEFDRGSDNPPIILSEFSISNSPSTDPGELQNPNEAYASGKILLSSQFSQYHPFNMYLPKINSKPPPIGCSNTALMGLLHYYRSSITPNGIHYQSIGNNTYELLSFDSISGMANLSAQINSFSNWWEQDLMAQLARYLTYINETELNLNGSPSSIDWEKIARYFGVTTTSSITFSPVTVSTIIINKIVSEMNAKRPILLHLDGGLSHLSIIDGYKYDETNHFLVHINFGWDGRSNGWYNLRAPITKVVKGENGETVEKTATQYRLEFTNLCPKNGCFSPESSDLQQNKMISGNLASEEDIDLFNIPLIKGNLSVQFSGYNTGYFFSVINSVGQVVFEEQVKTDIINITGFSPGSYQFRIARKTIPTAKKGTSHFTNTPAFPINYTLSYSMNGEGPISKLTTINYWANFPKDMSTSPQRTTISSPLIYLNGLKQATNFELTVLAGEELAFFTVTTDKRIKVIPNGKSGLLKLKVVALGSGGPEIPGSEREWQVIISENMSSGAIGETQIVAIPDLEYGVAHEVHRKVLVNGPCLIEGSISEEKLLAPTSIIKDKLTSYTFGVSSGRFGDEVLEPTFMDLVISVPKTPRFSSENIDLKYYFALISCPNLNTSAMNLDQILVDGPQ